MEQSNLIAQTNTLLRMLILSNFEWCVVANEGDYAMLVSRYTIQNDRLNDGITNQRNHNTVNFIEWPSQVSGSAELGPESRGRMRNWWHNPTQVSPSLRLQARDAYIPANTDHTIWQPEVHTLNEEWLSTPVQDSVVPDNPVFFLSEAEVYQRLGQAERADRITNSITANGTAEGIAHYWLRSIGADTDRVARVNNTGNWWYGWAHVTDTPMAFRPTIWVRR